MKTIGILLMRILMSCSVSKINNNFIGVILLLGYFVYACQNSTDSNHLNNETSLNSIKTQDTKSVKVMEQEKQEWVFSKDSLLKLRVFPVKGRLEFPLNNLTKEPLLFYCIEVKPTQTDDINHFLPRRDFDFQTSDSQPTYYRTIVLGGNDVEIYSTLELEVHNLKSIRFALSVESFDYFNEDISIIFGYRTLSGHSLVDLSKSLADIKKKVSKPVFEINKNQFIPSLNSSYKLRADSVWFANNHLEEVFTVKKIKQ